MPKEKPKSKWNVTRWEQEIKSVKVTSFQEGYDKAVVDNADAVTAAVKAKEEEMLRLAKEDITPEPPPAAETPKEVYPDDNPFSEEYQNLLLAMVHLQSPRTLVQIGTMGCCKDTWVVSGVPNFFLTMVPLEDTKLLRSWGIEGKVFIAPPEEVLVELVDRNLHIDMVLLNRYDDDTVYYLNSMESRFSPDVLLLFVGSCRREAQRLLMNYRNRSALWSGVELPLLLYKGEDTMHGVALMNRPLVGARLHAAHDRIIG